MPRKGRLVQPRHIFPWIAAPYIEMLRILWRIEGVFLLPIKYLQAWTVSAIFGIMGVLFSIALFIPRLTETPLQASPAGRHRSLITPLDLPQIPEEDLALPPDPHGRSDLRINQGWLTFKGLFNQQDLVTTHSRPTISRRTTPSSVLENAWRVFRKKASSSYEPELDSYILAARVWRNNAVPEPQEYVYDRNTSGTQGLTTRYPTLHIQKSSPQYQSLHEPVVAIITVTNNGEEPIDSAIVTEKVSDISRVIQCEPAAWRSADSKSLVWELFALQPGKSQELRITIQPDGLRTITQTTEVEFSSAAVIAETMVRERPADPVLPVEPVKPAAPVQPAQPEVVPPPVKQPKVVGKPKLILDFEPPRTVKVGEEVEAYYTITNVGTADATGIRLLVEVPASLRHRYGKLVEHKVSRLAPKEKRRALFAALAEGTGSMALNWTLEADELENQSNSEWLAVSPAPEPVIPAPAPTSIPADVKSSIPSGKSSIPLASGNAPSGNSSIPNAKSSIPLHGPAELEEPDSTTPALDPISDLLNSKTPLQGSSTKPLSPALSSDVPPAQFGRRPLTEPSSNPNWATPDLGQDPTLQTDRPIDPVLAPDTDQPLHFPNLNPGSLDGVAPETPAPTSTIPPSAVPPAEGPGQIKVQ